MPASNNTSPASPGFIARIKTMGLILFEAGKKWVEDDSASLAAGIAYYAIFSLVPLLMILTTIVATIFGDEAANGLVSSNLENFLGANTAKTIENAIEAAAEQSKNTGVWASLFGGVLLLFTASRVFTQLQEALNRVWNVEAPVFDHWTGTARNFLRKRALALLMVLGMGLLSVSVVLLNTTMDVINTTLSDYVGQVEWFWRVATKAGTLGIYTLMFAALIKFVPDVNVPWRCTWFGAGITSILFVIGESLLSWYLATNSTASAYGAAGAVISVMTWIYYNMQIIFFGAEVSQAIALHTHASIEPEDGSEWINDEDDLATQTSDQAT